MAGLSITGQMKVSTLQEGFLKEFGLTLRVYDGREFADPSQTLSQVRRKKGSGKHLSVAKNMKVGNLEQKFNEEFGLKVQVAGSDDSYLCNDELTLNAALQADEKKLVRKERKASVQGQAADPQADVETSLPASPQDSETGTKEITLHFRYSNGDTGEDFDESGYTVKVQSQRLQESLHNWLNDRDEASLKRFAIDLIGHPDFNECEEYGVAFGELKEIFFWRGVDKLGWGDVMVEIAGLSVAGEEVELTELERELLGDDCKVQLVTGGDPDMYMLDCVL